MPYTGELIAISTVLCWTISVQFFEAASKRVGATPVNIIRIVTALVLFSLLLFFKNNTLIPLDFPLRSWFFLGLSGIIGFFIGDIFLFKALVEIGPRMSMLIFSLAAPVSALIGWAFLDETYVIHQWVGMVITLSGVGLVILEKQPSGITGNSLHQRVVTLKGVMFGVGGMFGQACGYVMSKTGMQTDTGYLDAFASTQIRAIAAFVCFVVFFTLRGQWGRVFQAVKNTRALVYTATGAFVGPFLGVSLSLMTLHYLSTGVASTFLSMTPVCIIPFSIYLHKERVSVRAFAGALVAVAGIWLLMAE
ncbi:putative permease (DMT super family) [Desulforapulum autotrophicum HRM2]|uniref:Permease (DMT super family) n=1 Tax=Desulforapulum autotrophicum (strain ATCC 43914 / DSM 3382 / VKM B-1955 / HRM2) TaxID=177437 RepID=C0QIS4_DESAH|nr:DMT family transporter [Desulforapulum autotrophicum]ACN13714.1 putative permease (DMT super family) [Desulforapulum autotrophicum HRM2]